MLWIWGFSVFFEGRYARSANAAWQDTLHSSPTAPVIESEHREAVEG